MSAAGPNIEFPEVTLSPELDDLEWKGPRIGAGSPGAWTFLLFILVNATLFVRPAEILPSLEKWPIYAVLVTAAILVALPALLEQLTFNALRQRPITACIIGVFLAIVCSHVSNSSFWDAREKGTEFLKVLLYYLLLLVAVNTIQRMRALFIWLVVLATIVTVLAVLQFHGVIAIPSLAEIAQSQIDPETGEPSYAMRLVSTGIFNDPNDLCLLLVLAMAAAAHGIEEKHWGKWRFVWILPIILFGYAIMLTQSRGGFVGLIVAITVYIWTRLGWRRALPLAVLVLPIIFYLFAGRQTELGVAEDTGQQRVQLWSLSLTIFRGSPFFGIGAGKLAVEMGQVSHNSFLHTFVELGVFGGAMFLGAFSLSFRSVQRLGVSMEDVHEDLARFRPYLMAILAGYAAGMMSLSRAYVVPTYLVLGMAAAYVQITRAHSPVTVPIFCTRMLARLAVLASVFLVGMYIFVRLFVNWG